MRMTQLRLVMDEVHIHRTEMVLKIAMIVSQYLDSYPLRQYEAITIATWLVQCPFASIELDFNCLR